MSVATGLVLVNQHHAGLIFCFNLKESKVLEQYHITHHKTKNVSFEGSMINTMDLVSSQYEKMPSNEIFRSIAIQRISLLQLFSANKYEEVLYDQCKYPRDIARLTIDYLIGETGRNRFFSAKRKRTEENTSDMNLESSAPREKEGKCVIQ